MEPLPADKRERQRGMERIGRHMSYCYPNYFPQATAHAGKSHLEQAIGQAAIQQGYRLVYREMSRWMIWPTKQTALDAPQLPGFEVTSEALLNGEQVSIPCLAL